MKKRLITGGIIAIVLAAFFLMKLFVNDYIFDALILFIAAFASYESSKIFTKAGLANNLILSIVAPGLFFVSNFLGIWYFLPVWAIILIDVGIILCLGVWELLFYLFKKSTTDEMRIYNFEGSRFKFCLKRFLSTILACFYPSFLIMTMMMINHIDVLKISNISTYNNLLSIVGLMLTFLIPIFTDTFAMLMGTMIGGKKLCPKISPNKKVSGAIGGSVWCTILCLSIYLIMYSTNTFYNIFADGGFPIWAFAIIVFLGSIVAQIGDLFESFWKRKANIKDSGRLLPGHGGMLDRVDSYVFICPMILISLILVVVL